MDRLIVDANILFSALLRDSTTRHIILHEGLDLHTPDWLWTEFERNREMILRKSRATPAALDALVTALQDRIRSIPLDVIRPHLGEAQRRLGQDHAMDAPYVAAAIAISGGVWSHDKRLAKSAEVPVWTTAGLVGRA